MSKKSDLIAQINALQVELAALNRVPDDTFNLGTVVRFVTNNNTVKWHYLKTAVNNWSSLEGNSSQDNALADWVALAFEQLGTTYFEVYVLSPANTPWFASA